MPELPDVENYTRYFKRHALRKTVTGVHVGDRRALAKVSPETLRKRALGSQFSEARRHGKHLLARLSKGGWITMHFGMTGYLAWFKDGDPDPRYDRVRFDFGKAGHLAFVDPRLFGRVGLVEDADAFIAQQRLGPDALDPHFTFERFKEALRGRGTLKAVLMDQSRIAGIGNIYADEILFQARLHPLTDVRRLTPAQMKALYTAMRRVLKVAIAAGAGAEHFTHRLPKSYLLRQREKGGKCPRNHGPLKVITAAGRTTYFCPVCQKKA
ncbi:MAG TPA: DNA-formamidopyrimidine glycosylase family protein [Alphaproteobacteria bacterium]